MKNWSWLLIPLLVFASAHAELFRWVGPDGKVTYSDTPPPSSAKQVEKKVIANEASNARLPFELARAVKANPVTLYTTGKCGPCDDARNLLHTRGVPYSEKTVNNYEEVTKFKQIAGDGQLPLLVVGSQKQKGFESNAWDTLLTNAGYPASNHLPADFRNSSPESIVQKPKVVAPPSANTAGGTNNTPQDTQPAAGNAPPGFRF